MGLQSRLANLCHFYEILATLEDKVGGARTLDNCDSKTGWPERGIYFFLEPGEFRSDFGDGLRIVRVGTHALKSSSRRKLWDRLRQHRGTNRPSGGNHRGSIFRLLVGKSLIERDGVSCPSWELGKSKPRKASERNAEEALERKVSSVIGSMPFLWLAVEDDPGPRSIRGYIERNTIALLSNYDRPPLDPPSRDWLGTWCDRERVRASGLWNNRHVEEQYRPEFLETLICLVNAMGRN